MLVSAASIATDRVDAALAEAHAKYVARTPESGRMYENAQRSMPGGNTRTTLFFPPYPLTMVKGEACYLWDADGYRYIDFLGDYSAGLLGHSHPEIRFAITAALEEGLNLSAHNRYEARLAELVCQRIASIEKVRFTNSGTEANLMAVAAATAFTKRRKILVFDGGYHGGVLSFATRGSPVNVPHDFLFAAYNDADEAAAVIRRHSDELAAVLVEPALGSGGCIPGDVPFIRRLRDEASSVGALLIFDEVMTSRLGPGGLQGEVGVAPDLTTLGKYIGGGLSFGAFGGREDIMEMFDPRSSRALPHAGTFNNNVLSMAAGIAALGSIYTATAAAQLNRSGEALRHELNQLCLKHESPFQFTGIGSLMNVHATRGDIRSAADVGRRDHRLNDLYFHFLLEHQIYIARRGYMALMLPIGAKERARLVDVTDEFLSRHGDLWAC